MEKKVKLVSSSDGATVNKEIDFEIRETFHPWRVRREGLRIERERVLFERKYFFFVCFFIF